MGRLRWSLNALKRDARENLDGFILEDGSRFYFDPTGPEVFLHSLACLAAQGEGKTTFPEPPPVVKAIARAKDRAAAFANVYDAGFLVMPYNAEALIERGEFVPCSMVAGRELGEPLRDLSE
jgi:hypothetical protein